jgi:3-oxoacyl-[acyl-carrier-protein] synthase-3
MTIGIAKIGYHIAPESVKTLDKAEQFGLSQDFVRKKTGFVALARKDRAQKASDLCVGAFGQLLTQVQTESDLADIDFICVCTQNGDYQIPHTSAVVQDKLVIDHACAAFDISLGCSGYVYALHITKSFMESNGFSKGLLFTSDPYSEIIDPADKNTALLFGDAGTVTLLSDNPVFDIGKGLFETHGKHHDHLIKRDRQKLVMNGRGIFNFTMSAAPDNIDRCLQKNHLSKSDIDVFLLHQASKYIVDHLCRRLALPPGKVPFTAGNHGNTVSSSIPLALRPFLDQLDYRCMLLCGFGVGLSIATTVLRRR